jgi:ribosomal protein RSM22 (predicted rRNA methylase)
MDTKQILNSIPGLINKTFPIPGRFRSALPRDIAELSRLLTNNRGERSLSYLGRPNYLSAYLNYFLPWNLYRLCFLLPTLDINLSAGNKITDLGCGPLTLVSALWITRPDLRAIPLEFNCIDRSSQVLDAGKKFFTALSGSGTNTDSLWKINLIKKEINLQKGDSHKENASLICAINVFNEMYEHLPHNNTEALRRIAANAALFMQNKAAEGASVLTVEPGVPQSGKFISLLRDSFLELGCHPLSPCTHSTVCPLAPRHSTGKNKQRWCHFAFEAADVPKELKRLSAAAKLPKQRLVLSFLFTGKQKPASQRTNETEIRIISDAFPLPGNNFGRYGCSAKGLVLLTGDKNSAEKMACGNSFCAELNDNGQRDEKSGALIRNIK